MIDCANNMVFDHYNGVCPFNVLIFAARNSSARPLSGHLPQLPSITKTQVLHFPLTGFQLMGKCPI